MVEYKVLLVEDDEDIAGFLQLELEHEGYTVAVQKDGRAGLQDALEQEWDVVLLDVMLPGLSGFELCRRLRAESQVPILMITARVSIPDRIAGLDYGADDYVVKPFAIEELLARIRRLIRRVSYSEVKDSVLTLGDIELFLSTREVYKAKQLITLTGREFELLQFLLDNKNQVLSREAIIRRVWGYDYVGDTNIVDVYIRYLRAKIDGDSSTSLIHTVRGVGYMVKDA